MAFSNETRENILEVTEGVLETAVDLALFCALMGVDMLTLADKQRLYRPKSGDSDWVLDVFEKIRYKSLKNAINNARKKGLIEKIGSGKLINPTVTKMGKDRLESKFPKYQIDRPWDSVLHLVTYDVPEEHKKSREIFREKLSAIGCGMLQKSVWITPYNPRGVLEDHIDNSGLRGDIIISSVGKDGSIGEDSVEDLVYRVYKLDKLNERYKDYIKKYGNVKGNSVCSVFAYLSVLKDDPQLPFELLPKKWLGDRSYKIFSSNNSWN